MVDRHTPTKTINQTKSTSNNSNKNIIINHQENANLQTTVKYYFKSIKMDSIKVTTGHQSWQSIPVKPMQEDCRKFENSMSYIRRLCFSLQTIQITIK